LAKQFDDIDAIGHQAAIDDGGPQRVNRRQPLARCQVDDKSTAGIGRGVRRHDARTIEVAAYGWQMHERF
jgi:hypothetical protein